MDHAGKILLLVFAALLLAAPAMAATGVPNFTPIIPTNGSEMVHVNQTYITGDNGSMPVFAFLTFLFLGVLFFILSCIVSAYPERFNEIDLIFAALASMFLFLVSFNATSVDVVTSSGATSVVNGTRVMVYLLENHTNYPLALSGLSLWAFSFISSVNTIRILVNGRRLAQLTNEKQGR